TPRPTLLPYTTLFRSPVHTQRDPGTVRQATVQRRQQPVVGRRHGIRACLTDPSVTLEARALLRRVGQLVVAVGQFQRAKVELERSEEHTSELQSRENL